jgi:hypothetical protein
MDFISEDCSAYRNDQKYYREKRLHHVAVLVRKHQGGQEDRTKFTRSRGADDIAAKCALELTAVTQDRQEHAHGRRRQRESNQDRTFQQASRVEEPRNHACRAERDEPSYCREAQ